MFRTAKKSINSQINHKDSIGIMRSLRTILSSKSIAVPAQPVAEYYEVVKQLVAASPHRTHKSATYHPMQTYCFDSASFIVRILTGHELIKNQKIAPKDFFGEMKSSENLGVTQLFSPASKSEHLIFHIVHGRAHAFVVEKMSDGKTTFWRVYQSQMGEFSLAEWMGIDKWKLSAEKSYTKQFKLCGEGRKISDASQLRDCIQTLTPPLLGGSTYDAKEDIFSVAMISVDPENCHEKLRKIFQNQQIKLQEISRTSKNDEIISLKYRA
jgi:hypothetical protein